MATVISAISFSLVWDTLSVSGSLITKPKAIPLGMIVALCIRSEAGILTAIIA